MVFKKGNIHSEKWKEVMSLKIGKNNPFYGKHHSEKSKRKISLKKKGIKNPKISEIRKRLFKEGKLKPFNPMIGKHHSEESKRKISLANKGKTNSEETRKKISLSKTKYIYPNCEICGKKLTGLKSKRCNAHKKIFNKHIHLSEEHKAKIRLARVKQIIPNKDTSIEIIMQDKLKKLNIPFEKHKPIFGQPDIFIKPNVCIFCDGNHWHNYPIGNVRDKEVYCYLRNKGFIVLRFWEHEIHEQSDKCLERILKVIK